MHLHRTSGELPSPARAQGLGICDAVRITFEPSQVAGLIDELDELRGPLEQERSRERSADEIDYQLACLRAMRAQLPPAEAPAAGVLVGPADLIAQVVRGAAAEAAERLARLIARVPGDAAAVPGAADAAAAWVETWLACRLLEGFEFEPRAYAV
jgi:hypothetical protein